MPPRLRADKDKAVVLAFFEEQHAKGLALLEMPEDDDCFYAVQAWYGLLFKAIHKAFSDPDLLITRLNVPVMPQHLNPDYKPMTYHERARDHLKAVEMVVALLKR